MPEPSARSAGPPGGPRPPAPPGTGADDARPDPSDPGAPIVVRLAGRPLGDLGHASVDSRGLVALVRVGGPVSAWLQDRGIDETAVREVLRDDGWPPDDRRQPAPGAPPVEVTLDDWPLGALGEPTTDTRLLTAILARDRAVGRWLGERGVSRAALAEAFPDAI